jgi:hypothetical protein
MMLRSFGLLLALTAAACSIPIDRRTAETIPTELAVSKLSEMLPKAWYIRCLEREVSIDQSEIQAWSVTKEGLEFRTSHKDPFRLSWSLCRGVELKKAPFRTELRVFAAGEGNARKHVYTVNWKDEVEARRAGELFESLRGDR